MGFKVTVEDAKCIQANAFIQEGIFQEFTIKEEQLTFKINLSILLVNLMQKTHIFRFFKLTEKRYQLKMTLLIIKEYVFVTNSNHLSLWYILSIGFHLRLLARIESTCIPVFII